MTKTPLAEEISTLQAIYRDRVLPLKTRRVVLLGRKCEAVLMKTFLGHELRMGRKRITCPDLMTARYLRVFGELGMAAVRIPYDPTRTAAIVSELEASFARIEGLLADEVEKTGAPLKRARQVYARIRAGLNRCEAEISNEKSSI